MAQNLTNVTEADTTTEPITTQLYTTIETTEAPTLEPTIDPSINPTSNPTIEPTVFITTKDTFFEETESEGVQIKVEIIVTLSTTNITVEQLTNILTASIALEHPDLGLKQVDINQEETANAQFIVTWNMIIIAESESDAKAVEKTIESDDFKTDLKSSIETETHYEVLQIETDAIVIYDDDDVKDRPQWLDPTTYVLLNWIIVGAALCIICILTLFMCRCCWLCCNRGKRKKKKNKYQVGGPLFESVTNKDSDNAFKSDLFQAIEMNAQKKFLKRTKSPSSKLGSLDDKAVAQAFDMDFDEIKPMNQQSSASIDDTKKGDEKKESNEGLPMTTTKNNNDDNVPEAPEPPLKDMSSMDDYELL